MGFVWCWRWPCCSLSTLLHHDHTWIRWTNKISCGHSVYWHNGFTRHFAIKMCLNLWRLERIPISSNLIHSCCANHNAIFTSFQYIESMAPHKCMRLARWLRYANFNMQMIRSRSIRCQFNTRSPCYFYFIALCFDSLVFPIFAAMLLSCLPLKCVRCTTIIQLACQFIQ